jgi:regulatory protein
VIPIKNKNDFEENIIEIRRLAFLYLEKYSCSKQQIRIYLLKKMMNKPNKLKNKNELINLIDTILENLEEKNYLSDELYSNSKAKFYLKKGYSLNKIRSSLIKKGISDKYVKSSISRIKDEEIDPDFFSAIKICKKRRIGPSREEGNRPLFYKKDMGILARNGFSYELSKKVLDLSKNEFKKLSNMV